MYIKGQEQRARKVKSANKNKTMKTNKFKRRVIYNIYIYWFPTGWNGMEQQLNEQKELGARPFLPVRPLQLSKPLCCRVLVYAAKLYMY